jgi:chromatin remodeling complex protein RSC6
VEVPNADPPDPPDENESDDEDHQNEGDEDKEPVCELIGDITDEDDTDEDKEEDNTDEDEEEHENDESERDKRDSKIDEMTAPKNKKKLGSKRLLYPHLSESLEILSEHYLQFSKYVLGRRHRAKPSLLELTKYCR